MNVAIIGSGFIAGMHAQALQTLKQNIVLVVDPNETSAKRFADTYGIKTYSTQFNDCLDSTIDVVHICTPPTLHYEMAKAVLENNKHCVCEKPLCLETDKAKDLMERSKRCDKVCAVNFNTRYHDGVLAMKDIVSKDDFGRVLMVHGAYEQAFHLLPQPYSWRYNEKVAGKMRATSEIGSHFVDLSYFVTNKKITEVTSLYGCFYKDRYVKDGMMYEEEIEGSEKIEVLSDDAACISFKMEDGGIGNVFLSEISHGKNNRIDLSINGSKKSTWWNSEELAYVHSSTGNEIQTNVNGFHKGFVTTMQAFFEDVYKTIETNEKGNFATFEDAYYNTCVLNAIYDASKEEGKMVKVCE